MVVVEKGGEGAFKREVEGYKGLFKGLKHQSTHQFSHCSKPITTMVPTLGCQ